MNNIIKVNSTKIILAILIFFVLFPTAFAQVAPYLNVQGKLSDINDEPKTGSHNFTFALYNVSTDGTELWSESQTLDTTDTGLWSALLGSVTPLNLAFDVPYYLEVNVDGETLVPRYTLTSTPYALRANVSSYLANNARTLGDLYVSGILNAARINSSQLCMNDDCKSSWSTGGNISGAGSINYIPKFISGTNIGNSIIYDNGTGVGIGTTTPTATLHVIGSANISGAIYLVNSKCSPGQVLTADQTTGLLSCVTDQTGVGGGGASVGWSISGLYVYNNTPGVAVGIGTASPQYTLDVNGTLRGSNGLTIGAGSIILPTGSIANIFLANSSFTIGAGTGLTGGGTIALGGSATLNFDSTYTDTLYMRIGTGITIPIGNVTGIINAQQLGSQYSYFYYNTTQAFNPVLNGILLPLANITGSTSQQCDAGQALMNVTLTNGVLTSACVNISSGSVNASVPKFSGGTANSYTGNITNGTKSGYDAANTICNIEYSGSRMCMSADIFNTIVQNFTGYTGTGWIANGPPGYTANANDCKGWTSPASNYLGPFWDWDNTPGGGAGFLTACNGNKKIYCCK